MRDRSPSPWLVLLLLLVATFSAATVLQPHAVAWDREGGSDNVLKVVLGDGRRLFATQFFVKADVSYHSGYYPSIFDQAQAPKDSSHMTSEEGSAEEEEHERQMNFLGKPRDWIEGFGRHFMVTDHTHLERGDEREILPWLRISAELDPQRIDTYTVASYWLRSRLNRPTEAEQFLREGIRNNPTSYELLFELGCLYRENYHDANRARNVWELALRRWREQESGKKEPNWKDLERIAVYLARLEEEAGNFPAAINYLELAIKVSPRPEALRQQIEELKQKAAVGK